ncbi:hypothetical protein R1T40_01095 [Tritonibacter scottomollicae]|uniref:AAA+ ATPase domain-containing protein n=1 Tax=Tritonibacter scottomollicae TaxID=483013 RepID=A0ABZ0HFY4_TRISK|nr:hypothetical protein [Tritonibacter scottomollicae]WOI33387.1 hypothetical protein R1T40_01095 [Tritonibacter scottomollicae]
MADKPKTDDSEEAPKAPIAIDKVRASKAGHAFHEAWAARTALELLSPSTDLLSITLEGFDEKDERELGTGAVEIADLVRYHGGTDVAHSHRVAIVQFKYSIASANKAVRAADLAGTLKKFAVSDTELCATHGERHVKEVVRYEFATNRPIHESLRSAISDLITGSQSKGDVARQASQIIEALRAYPHPQAELLNRLELIGSKGSLVDAERAISSTLAAWSEPGDPDAEKRLLKLRNLIRIKAGPGSDTDKHVDRIAVLAELEIEHEERLYPTPDAFPDVGDVVERRVMSDLLVVAREPGLPLVIHAAGGMGKTVLMQGLAEQLRVDGPVVLFDGFGAGRWRDPSDNRHLPERTLVHLANLLAGDGLCDIFLPVTDITALLKAFRRRLEQAVASARNTQQEAQISLVLDAVDHAGLAAQDTATQSFAHLLIRSLSTNPIDGIRIIASCRTERRSLATGGNSHREFAIPLFTDAEARSLIASRAPDCSQDEIAALLMRSGRNPRCLDNLIAAGRPFDPISFPDSPIEPGDLLDELLRKRLDDARETARMRGTADPDIDLLLTGLALLAPPVPIEELAAAHGLIAEQVESFAADLAPLLERTPHGLMFRDEPTETLIRKTYGNDQAGRERVISALQERQVSSNYAARALPALLTSLRNTDQLIALAFDTRIPASASQVSGRDIRLARITAAIALTNDAGRRDDLFRLLLEASLVAAGHERSDRFLYEHPDLAAVSGDPEALRRLAATFVGWPGGKHAALALANSFAGDFDEARRHARRAIDWHNWAAHSNGNTRFRKTSASRQWDDIGFAYVEMLAGNDVRIAQFFTRRDDGSAYAKFRELFDLLERHTLSLHPPSSRVHARLARCRHPSRALFAAALQFGDRDEAWETKLIAEMAAAPASAGDHDGLAIANVQASARAIALGLKREGSSILDGAGLKAPSIHVYSSYFDGGRAIDVAVFAAGVRSALSGRPVQLLDIVPTELIELVPKSSRTRGPAAFSRALEQKLAEPKFEARRRPGRRRDSLNGERRSEYSRALSSRIKPLLPYAQDLANVIRPPLGKTRSSMLAKAFNRLVEDVKKASNYPYRDGKAYLARTGFRGIFYLADALGAFDASLAKQMVDWLAGAPGLFTSELTDYVTRLSRFTNCHDAALVLAAHVETKIQLDTDVGSRVAAYGRLARAVWRVSTEEAGAYFRRALDLAEAIGSDDFDRANHLLELTAHYKGAELSPEASHTLARVFELNQGEGDRFPWIEYAESMVPIAGRATLAMINRLDDRAVASLGMPLGPVLTVLVRQSKLSAETAATLFGLAAPREAWTWRISDFAGEAMTQLPAERHEWFFGLLLVEIDRNDQLVPAHDTIEALARLASEYLPETSAARVRVEGLLSRRAPKDDTPWTPAPELTLMDSHLVSLDLSDPDEIDRQVLSEAVDQTGRRWPDRTLLALAKRVATPVERLVFLRAVVESSAASLPEKLRSLGDHLEVWSTASPAMRDCLPELGRRLASKHASELASSSADAWGSWRGLERFFLADRSALVEHVVAGLRSDAVNLGGNGWLAMAARLAANVSDEAIADGINRFLAISAEKLPNEVGDGPWDKVFSAPNDEADLVAGLLWARLGHPVAAMRWRAAHAVRRMAEIERFDIIAKLIEGFDNGSGSPFTDAKFPFYVMHSQLWLLIALSRIAKDSPGSLLRHRAFFERVVDSSDFPHVVMRSFAKDALRAIAAALAPAEAATLLDAVAFTNVSPYPHAPRTSYVDPLYASRPDTSPRPDDVFHLDYDFNKYQVAPLCRVFGSLGWEVEDRIWRWVRVWDASVRAMHECPRSSGHGEAWSSGYVPDRDLYGGYLGWHALMLTAGEFLAERTVVGEHWDGDAWAAFLSEYSLSRGDGLWLADLTDPFPIDLPEEADVPMPDGGADRSAVGEDARLLAPILGFRDGKVAADWIPAAGRWSMGRDTTLTLRSVVAKAGDARSTVMALLSDEPFFRWLPDDEDEITRQFGQQGHSVTLWVAQTPNTHLQLDRHDPYACTSALDRPFPTEATCQVLGVKPGDPIVRKWRIENSQAFYAEAWGAEGGRGEHAWREAGSRIFVSRSALMSFLTAKDMRLVVALKLQKYHRSKSGSRGGDTSAFSHRWLLAIINARGDVWIPHRLSKHARRAIDDLDSDRRRDFYPRFRAIAGLADEWLARETNPQIDAELYRSLLEQLEGDETGPL